MSAYFTSIADRLPDASAWLSFCLPLAGLVPADKNVRATTYKQNGEADILVRLSASFIRFLQLHQPGKRHGGNAPQGFQHGFGRSVVHPDDGQRLCTAAFALATG